MRSFVAGQPLEDLFVSTVTFAEIRYGIEAVADPIRRAEINDWLLHRVQSLSRPVQRDTDSTQMSAPSHRV